MRTIQIDQGHWQEGDTARIEAADGSLLVGRLKMLSGRWHVVAFGNRAFIIDGSTQPSSVTREVPDIEEPTTIGAVAKFADGTVAVLADDDDDRYWLLVNRDDEWPSWARLVGRHGPAVAVSEHPSDWARVTR